MILEGKVVDVVNSRIFEGEIEITDGTITSVREKATNSDQYILPGLIDSHVHVESSMLIPSEFARLAVVHGTVATVSDPHEIGNVLGVKGVEFMIENGNKVPFKFYFGAPSCVPATPFETAGAVIDSNDIDYLLSKDEIVYLAEMMNFPGVLFEDEEVMKKLAIAKKHGKVIDGHAPGLRGEDAKKYIENGISTDHECVTADEARDKLQHGMKIAIREGSAAKNFEALIELIAERPEMILFCSDDKHPNDLAVGHINQLLQRTVGKGYNAMHAIQAATINPVKHYGLNVGLLQEGDPADISVFKDIVDFEPIQTYVAGKLVAEKGKTLIESIVEEQPNNYYDNKLSLEDLKVKGGGDHLAVIEVFDGQLITGRIDQALNGEETIESNVEKDLLKLVVLNRYQPAKPAIAFVKNFGLKKGALASTVGHDSHNIMAVGANDDDLLSAINLLHLCKGGISLASGDVHKVQPLPVAGLMSAEDGYLVADKYEEMDRKAKELGSPLAAPYMTLSFLALPVIPHLKLTDKGLFDVDKFDFVPMIS